jgi:hypothetical protein
MSASTLLRPAAAAVACVLLGGCSVDIQNDGHMFQRWADQVEKIPVDGSTGDGADRDVKTASAPAAADAPGAPVLDPMAAPPGTAEAASKDAGLRQPLVVDVVDRLDMPNAKEAGLRAMLKLVHAAAVSAPASAAETAGLRQAIAAPPVAVGRPQVAQAHAVQARLIQLAAYPSDSDARAAWRRLASAHPDAFSGLSARFERADLGGKGVWTRLKVQVASAATAQRVCAAAKLARCL